MLDICVCLLYLPYVDIEVADNAVTVSPCHAKIGRDLQGHGPVLEAPCCDGGYLGLP